MVARSEWGKHDDKKLLAALLEQGPDAQEWDVDWGSLVPGRDARKALRRWHLMEKLVPSYVDKSFAELLDYLVAMYCPFLREPPDEQAAEEALAG